MIKKPMVAMNRAPYLSDMIPALKVRLSKIKGEGAKPEIGARNDGIAIGKNIKPPPREDQPNVFCTNNGSVFIFAISQNM